jgi:hypothetical protein
MCVCVRVYLCVFYVVGHWGRYMDGGMEGWMEGPLLTPPCRIVSPSLSLFSHLLPPLTTLTAPTPPHLLLMIDE